MESKKIRLKNLQNLLTETGTAVALAKAAGTSPVYLSQILSQKTKAKIGDKLARKLEHATGKPKGWLDAIHNADEISGNKSSLLSRLPLLLATSEIEAWIALPQISTPAKIQTHLIQKNLSEKTFLFEVTGHTMINPYNASESLIPRELVFVDPTLSPQTGQLVLAKFAEHDIRIRQYQEDGLNKFLCAFDPRIPIQSLNGGIIIIGTIIATYRSKL